MFPLLGVALALNLQVKIQVGSDRSRQPVVRDSSADSASLHRRRGHDHGSRKAVTAEDQATAFKDASARATLLRARVARLSQDSALMSYDAMSYQRISVGMGFSAIGRDRLLFRHESAARVQWQQGVGVWVEARGQRSVFPIVSHEEAKKEIRNEMNDPDMNASIPYFPGYEPLWVGSDIARAQVDEEEIVNPIADGSEAYYTFQTGDSVSLKLPNKSVIRLREIKVRPRQPKWNLVVGSLWFDTGSGQLVRAAYRLSVPMDIWAVAQEEDSTSMDDVPGWVKPMITPMKAEVTAIAVEYGLYDGRFWMPRLRLAEGRGQVSFMHVPFKMEESFKYESVNGRDTLPPVPIIASRARARMPDSLTVEQQAAWRDSVRQDARERSRARADSARKGLHRPNSRDAQCDTSDYYLVTTMRFESRLKVATRVPCDESKLANSPDLPPSIYDPGDELFGTKDLEELKAQALSLSAQAPFHFPFGGGPGAAMLPPPVYEYGPSMMRYNRIEGFSAGASAEQQFGGGYSAKAVGRLGLADLEPNIELTGTRTNLVHTIGVGVYNHLVSASDWGRPLSFSSSFSALFFGRDEGFYYRSTGGEVTWGSMPSFGGGARIDWRAFVEQERSAKVNTNFAVNGADFPANFVARRGTYAGIGAQVNRDWGLDPRGLRVFSNLRLEAAYGDSLYGRGALDVTMSHGLGRLAGSVTLSGGSSLGALPPQRMWYLGGSQTVRGQSPDPLQVGNAFWLTRAELGSNDAGFRPTVFADLGWVGDRTKMSEVGRPMSGVGVGTSFLDGMFRFDVARGIYPRRQYRVDLYLEAKF